jgi:hypothetical protein
MKTHWNIKLALMCQVGKETPYTIINVDRSSCKIPVILVRYKSNLSFLDEFLKSTQISNFMKIHSRRTKLFHTDGRTDRHTLNTHMMKPIDAFCNFVTCLKVEHLIRHHTFSALSEIITITSLAHTQTHSQMSYSKEWGKNTSTFPINLT